MRRRNRNKIYERKKTRLRRLNLSPAEYQRRIQELARRLKI